MNLKDKVAIVTGGAGGIGEATVRLMAQEGARVIISDINGGGAQKVKENLSQGGAEVIAVTTDISDPDQVKELTEKALSAFGRIDILVNNAAVGSGGTAGGKIKIWEMTLEQWERVIRIDLNGYFLCCRQVIPHMIRNRYGRIVNVSSIAARTGGQAASTNYAAAKGGVLGFTKCLAKEVGEFGITVNAVAPGWTKTPMTRFAPPEVDLAYIKQTPLGRVGVPEDIARVILFLSSDLAGWMTGTTLDVNGGQAIL